MITDKDTNKLYLSTLLKEYYPSFFRDFLKALDKHDIEPKFLSGTKDVWCVDFMPIQVSENKFVQFQFDPSYLKPKKYHKTVSDPSRICNEINLGTIPTDIIVDGGNVVKAKNKVIMTTQVLKDNPQYSYNELCAKIIELLEIDQLILIPKQPGDFTGHSDGMLRFLNENTVLLNDFSKEPDREFVRSLYASLHNSGLEIIEISTSNYDNKNLDDATGNYINYLQIEDILFLPIFDRKEDEQVVKQFERIFQTSTIVPVKSNEIAKEGGILNCISWNIKE